MNIILSLLKDFIANSGLFRKKKKIKVFSQSQIVFLKPRYLPKVINTIDD